MAEGEGGTVKLPVAGPVKKKWLVIGGAVVAGVLGYAWWRARTSPADELPAEGDPGLDDYSGGVDTGATGGSTTPGISWSNNDQTPPDPDDLPPTTNGVWTTRGVAWMEGLGSDPLLVATVLGKYLARQPVTNNEADIIRTVIAAIGPPPQGEFRIIMIGTPSTPKPPDPKPNPTPAPTPAPAPQYYEVKVVKYTTKNPPWNSTISGIAAHYGKSASAVWNDAKNASLRSKRGKPELIQPGDIVYVRK